MNSVAECQNVNNYVSLLKFAKDEDTGKSVEVKFSPQIL